MQIETQFTSGNALRPSHPDSPDPAEAAGSAFSEEFLEALRLLAARARDCGGAVAAGQPAAQRAAVLSGPFAVETVERPHDPPGHALVRPGEPAEPVASDEGPAGVLERRDEALRLAAVLPALADEPLHRLGTNRRPRGYSLHAGCWFVGHLAPAAGRMSAERRHALESHLDLARYLASHPHALALILESIGPEALPVLGRALARRVEALLPR